MWACVFWKKKKKNPNFVCLFAVFGLLGFLVFLQGVALLYVRLGRRLTRRSMRVTTRKRCPGLVELRSVCGLLLFFFGVNGGTSIM